MTVGAMLRGPGGHRTERISHVWSCGFFMDRTEHGRQCSSGFRYTQPFRIEPSFLNPILLFTPAQRLGGVHLGAFCTGQYHSLTCIHEESKLIGTAKFCKKNGYLV